MKSRRVVQVGCVAALLVSVPPLWSSTANAVPVAGFAPGTVIIADSNHYRILAVAPNGTQSTVLDTGLQFPFGVAVDSDSDVFIADSFDNRVIKLAPNGTQSTILDTGLNAPYAVAVDAAGAVLIADTSNNRVIKVAPNGTQSTILDTGLNHPSGVVAAADGGVIIADTYNNRVIKVAPNGTQSLIVGAGLNQPTGVTFDADGNLLIGDFGSHRVIKVAPDGSQSTVGTNLNGPAGVAVDEAGDVLIADYSNSQVVKVAPDGTQSTVGSNLHLPGGVAVVPRKPQTITYTSTAPSHARVGDTYTVTATGGDSGNPVTFTRNATSTGQCTVSNDGENTATVTFIGRGICAVFAHQEGNDAFQPAAVPARQRITVYRGTQTIEFTSAPPGHPYVGGANYVVSATGGSSGQPVTFTRSATSAGNCTVTNEDADSATVAFTGAGPCNVYAHQAGNADYLAAPKIRQHLHVYPAA